MFAKFVILLLCMFVLGRKQLVAEGCHAGHQHGSDSDEEEEGLIDGDYDDDDDDDMDGDDDGTDAQSRKKRALHKFRETDDVTIRENITRILRKYFRDCMLDKVGIIWDWKSVIDFTILDTIWYLYSSSVACSETKGTDTANCWKTCVEVLLRDNSSLIGPGKKCVEEYSEDFDRGKERYKPKRQQYSYAKANFTTEYSKCVGVTSTRDEARLFDETGTIISSEKEDRDIESIVKFVQRDVKCRICDYGFLPGTQIKPDFAENIESSGENKQGVWAGERVEYIVTWPFSFEALTRRDSDLRIATTFCNEEFAPTFTRDPPLYLGWADWVSWGKCIADCPNTGFRQRIRVCLDETRSSCRGDAVQKQACFNPNCVKWGKWSQWTPCISTCGISTQISFRTCKMGVIGEVGCEGDFKRIRNCAVKSCPVPWSQWSTCTVTCGKGGVQYRRGGESLIRIKTASRECALVRKCPDEWTNWTEWGECLASCSGHGIQMRERFCLGIHPCIGQSKETRKCVGAPCTSRWSKWSAWGTCVWKKRYRYCTGGKDCEGKSEEYKQCKDSSRSATLSSVIAKWGIWGAWSRCTHSCGNYGERVRFRYCDRIPYSSSNNCPERDKNQQHQPCNMQPCPLSVTDTDPPCEDDSKWNGFCKSKLVPCDNPKWSSICRKRCGEC